MVTVQAPRLFVSHTQIDSAANAETGCLRRWKFKWIDKLPEPIRGTQEFGEVAHKVCERWLGADDLGRDKDGNPVELYPEGWAANLDLADQDLIRRLIAAAIEKGVLRRVPGRQVELPFEIPMEEATLVGRIDLCAPGEVTDHKFLKSFRYLMSPAKLSESGQHLLYVCAYAHVLKQERLPVPKEWTLAVNGFSKDPEDFRVKRVEVKVPLSAAMEWRDRVLKPTIERMIALKAMGLPAQNWREIPDPENKNAACGAYGGCPMQRICGGLETVKGHLNRVTKYNAALLAKNPGKDEQDDPAVTLVSQEGTTDMGSAFDRLKSKATPAVSAAPAAPVAVAEAPAPAPAPLESVLARDAARLDAEADTPPPWGFADCTVTVCKGKGFNSKGSPCRLCTGRAEKERGILLSNYSWQIVGPGRIVWSSNDGETDGLVSFGPTEAPKVVEVQAVQAPAPAPTPVAEDVEESSEDEVEEAAEATNGAVKRGRGPGRPKQGLTLFINCAPTKGHKTIKLVYLTDVLHEWGNKAAVESGACEAGTEGAFYYMDAFKRRDFIASRAKTIADSLGSVNLVCTRGPDEDRLIAALSALEGTKVVEALK